MEDINNTFLQAEKSSDKERIYFLPKIIPLKFLLPQVDWNKLMQMLMVHDKKSTEKNEEKQTEKKEESKNCE